MEVDTARQLKKILTKQVLLQTIGQTNSILDDSSVLIGEGVQVGIGNTFYPNVVIEQSGDGTVHIGDNNIFYPGVYIISSIGSIRIGDDNEFGPNGCTIKANMSDVQIFIGNGGRYCDGVSIMGQTILGDGSQVLGAIIVQGCVLAAGGTFSEPDPDKRASVLKGFGVSRGITLEIGQVVNGSGNFVDAPVEFQRAYHPKK